MIEDINVAELSGIAKDKIKEIWSDFKEILEYRVTS